MNAEGGHSEDHQQYLQKWMNRRTHLSFWQSGLKGYAMKTACIEHLVGHLVVSEGCETMQMQDAAWWHLHRGVCYTVS